jgi:hypothetical protein
MQNENPVSHAPLPDRATDALAKVTVSAAGLNLITRFGELRKTASGSA